MASGTRRACRSGVGSRRPRWRDEVHRRPAGGARLSGRGDLDGAEKRQVIDAVVELFGSRRAMFASNYPVDSLRASYDATYGLFDEATRALSTEERRALFHDNAVRIYRME